MHNPMKHFPEGPIRGTILNYSHGPILPISEMKKSLDDIALKKYNFVLLKLNDLFACSKHPAVGWKYDTISPETLVELDIYAKEHFITLVPGFDSLNNHHKMLSLSEYLDIAEYPGAGTFAISNGNRFSVLRDYYSEIIACFSSKLVNIGFGQILDSKNLWHSRHLLKTHSPAELQAQNATKIASIVKNIGGSAIIGSNLILDIAELGLNLPANVMIWHEIDSSLSTRILFKQIHKLDALQSPIVLILPPSYSEKKIRQLSAKNQNVFGYIIRNESEPLPKINLIDPAELGLTSPHFVAAQLRYENLPLNDVNPLWLEGIEFQSVPVHFRTEFTIHADDSPLFFAVECSKFIKLFINGCYIGDGVNLVSDTLESRIFSRQVFEISDIVEQNIITFGVEAHFYTEQTHFIRLGLFSKKISGEEEYYVPIQIPGASWVSSITPQTNLDWTLPGYDSTAWK